MVIPPQTPTTPTTTLVWTGVANYQSEFQAGSPAPGWRYMWNANGKLGSGADYRQLLWSNVAGAYNTTGAATAVPATGKGSVKPDAYLALGASGGHPGIPNYNAVASYTIQAEDGAGSYRLANATIAKNDNVALGNEDGLSLMVYVNNTLTGNVLSVPTTGALVDFSRDLGQLSIGDSIYVVIYAVGNQNYDGFKNFNFTVQKLMPQAMAALVRHPRAGERGAGGDGARVVSDAT